MKAKLLIFASSLSLILCLSAATLWVRSHWSEDYLARRASVGAHDPGSLATWTIISFKDWLFLDLDVDGTRGRYVRVHHLDPFFTYASYPADPRGTKQLGILTSRQFLVPWWSLVALFALLPAYYVAAMVRRRYSKNKNICHVCGYDLTANTSGVCPECGSPVPQHWSIQLTSI